MASLKLNFGQEISNQIPDIFERTSKLAFEQPHGGHSDWNQVAGSGTISGIQPTRPSPDCELSRRTPSTPNLRR